MNKNKKAITFLIITIVLLSLVICYLLFKLNKLNASDSNKEQEVKTKEETKCQSSSDINCIYYEENGFKIEKKLGRYQDYEINGKTLYSADGQGISAPTIKQIIDNKYIIINTGEENFYENVYDLNGQVVIFAHPDNMWTEEQEMKFSDNKLTIEYYTVLDNYAGYNDDFNICTDKPLDSIVYLKQEVEYSNGTFGPSKNIKSKTLKEALKDYDKEC